MKNMPRSQIEMIATLIVNNGDIIALHGTSVNKALSIINSGFDFHRTSIAMFVGKDIENLCKYGWKENPPNDATSVVIEVPRDFIMELLNMSSVDEYNNWLNKIIADGAREEVLNALASYVYDSTDQDERSPLPPSFEAHIPQEFIFGAFIWCNGKTYLNLLSDESPLDNLSFVSNERFYSNLPPEEKSEFLDKMREKLEIEKNSLDP